MMLKALLSVGIVSFLSLAVATESKSTFQEVVVIEKLLANVSPAEAAPGLILASPSKELPNYYFHWTRDSALVLKTLVQLFERKSATDPAYAARLEKIIDDAIAFSRKTQLADTASGTVSDHFKNYGEPRFMLDGSGDAGERCRPQTDGPGLRALTTMAYIRVLREQGKSAKIAALYSKNASESYLKSDLEYVAHHWMDRGCDLWEETYGYFFYNRLIHRRAMLEGAELAFLMEDPLAADYYLQQIPFIETELEKHWDAQSGYLLTTLNWSGGNSAKKMNLDASVVLASNHTDSSRDWFYSATDDRIQATAYRLAKQFQGQYPINQVTISSAGERMAPGIGRYPEDIYDGASLTGGNAWFLLNHGFAELYLRGLREYTIKQVVTVTEKNRIFLTEALQMAAPRFEALQAGEILTVRDLRFALVLRGLNEMARAHLARAEFHSGKDGSMSEQFNRFDGKMQGARDLTWSYASALSARWVPTEQ